VAVIVQPQRGLTTGFQKCLTAKSLRNSFQNNANKVAENDFFTATTVTPTASPNAKENLYPANAIPADNADPAFYTLGCAVRFDKAGFITGARFCKATVATRAYHVFSIWDKATGIELARGSFTNETASGWQDGLLDKPLAVVANKTYVLSYQQNGDGYTFLNSAFATALVVGSITGLADGTDGPNGLFFQAAGYSDIPTFPTATFSASSYFITPIFVASAVTKNLTFAENENRDTLSATVTRTKNLTLGVNESKNILSANGTSNKALTFGETESKDVLTASTATNPTKDITFGEIENPDRFSQTTSKALPISIGFNENQDFTGQAIVPLITDLTGADWNSGTATGSALSEVQVIGTNLQYVTQFLANGTTMPVENLGTASPTVILPASPGPYTITMVGLGSTGIPVTFSKNLTITVVESKNILTATAAQSKNLTFTEAESKDILMLAVSKNAALIFGEVESKEILTMTASGTSIKNLTFSLNESADKLTANSTQNKNITFGETESKDVLTVLVTRSKNVTGGFVENRDTLSAIPASTKSLVFGETENRDTLTAATTSAKSLVFGEVESKDILSATTVSNKSIIFGETESQDRLTATLISNKSLTGGFVETLDKLTANVIATAFKSLIFSEVESKDVLTFTTGAVTSKNLTFTVNENRDTLNATPVSNKSLVFGEAESKNILTETVAFSKNITFGEIESQDKLTATSVQSKNLIFGETENQDRLTEAVTFNKNITFGHVENRDTLTWITGAAIFKNITFGINETQDKLAGSTTSSKNLIAGFVETQDKLTTQEVSTKPLGYIGTESQAKLAISVTLTSSAAPTITGDYGSAPGGSYLVLTGTGFLGTTAGMFAGVPLISYTVIDATHLGIIVPYGSTLSGSFSITNNVGTGTGGTFTRLPDLPIVPPSGTDGRGSFRKRKKRKYSPLIFAPLPDIPTEILVEQKGKTKEIAVQNEEGTARDIVEILEMLDALEATDALDL
jgi:Domain of unknown function (DUF4082)